MGKGIVLTLLHAESKGNSNWSSLMQRMRFREIHHQGSLWVTEAIEKTMFTY